MVGSVQFKKGGKLRVVGEGKTGSSVSSRGECSNSIVIGSLGNANVRFISVVLFKTYRLMISHYVSYS
jgi:hypothetical protein